MSPPSVTANNRTSAAVDRREWKAARVDVLMQCESCGAKATGRLNARRRLVSVNLPATFDRGVCKHSGCGGALRAFGLKGSHG